MSKIPGLDPKMGLNIGATDLQKNVPTQYLDSVLQVYNHALTRPFVIATAMTAISMVWNGRISRKIRIRKKKEAA